MNSVTDDICQRIVDFWHMLLVNDDADVFVSLFFVQLCYVLHLKKYFILFYFVCVCACGCVHD